MEPPSFKFAGDTLLKLLISGAAILPLNATSVAAAPAVSGTKGCIVGNGTHSANPNNDSNSGGGTLPYACNVTGGEPVEEKPDTTTFQVPPPPPPPVAVVAEPAAELAEPEVPYVFPERFKSKLIAVDQARGGASGGFGEGGPLRRYSGRSNLPKLRRRRMSSG